MSVTGGERVLVVIPCLNEAEALPSLLAQLVADGGADVIVVADGGSTDASRRIVEDVATRHPEIVLVDNPARLQSAGINRAVRQHGADHDWLVRIDAHCDYPARYVAGLLHAARATGAESVVVPMRTEGRHCFQRAVAAVQNSILGTGGSPHRHVTHGRFVEHGHHAAMRLDLFCRAGGYDESFSHNEDAELDQRLLALGAKIWLEPAMAIDYWPRRTLGSLFRQYRGYGSGRAMTAARHNTPMALRQMVPLSILPLVLLALLGVLLTPVTPYSIVLGLPAVGWALACLVGGVVLAIRARSACVLASGIAAMAMHLGWSLGNWRARLPGRPPGPPPTAILLEKHRR